MLRFGIFFVHRQLRAKQFNPAHLCLWAENLSIYLSIILLKQFKKETPRFFWNHSYEGLATGQEKQDRTSPPSDSNEKLKLLAVILFSNIITISFY